MGLCREVVALPADNGVVESLLRHAIAVGIPESEPDVEEAAVELIALSGRSRLALDQALIGVRYLQPGDDTDRAGALIEAALCRGDDAGLWK